MSAKTPVISVNEGKIQGIKKRSSFSGVEYYSFLGVPYGQSTAKQNRFKDPMKAKPWKNIFNATVEKGGCIQYSLKIHAIAGSEDCLFNNIHTQKLPLQECLLKPVIVHIHGGGYLHGSPETDYYGAPDYVMHHDIVYVCMSYRLHILGFLDLGLKECSGNQALKDMILSLKWIKENISSFNGDPNNVTLHGSSSGATAVHCLMLSPAAKGLFHKAILMGGYIFNPLFIIPEEHTKIATDLAQRLGYDTKNVDVNNMSIVEKKKLLTFLKKIPFDYRVTTNLKLQNDELKNVVSAFPSSLYGETIDEGENAVFPIHPRKLVNSMARIPVIVGICEKEAIMAFFKKTKPAGDTIEPFYKSYKQNCFGWGHNVSDKQVKMIRKKINSFYLGGNSMETASLSQQIDIQSDAAFFDIYDTLVDVVATDLPSSAYLYKFQFKGNAVTLENYVQDCLGEGVKGTYHATDSSYWAPIDRFWTKHKIRVGLYPQTREMIETFTKFMCTFARTGNPNYEDSKVEWKPSTPDNRCYLSIKDELRMVDGKLNGKGMEFWQDVKNEFFQE